MYWSAVMTLQLWFSFYYTWLLHHQTAFYVKLLIETIYDLRYFLVFYIMIIVTFSSTYGVMDQRYRQDFVAVEDGLEKPNTIVQDLSNNRAFDAFLQVWALGLGDFELDQFSGKHNNVPFYVFIAASFLTNIVFLNMMIAIMSDTFTRLTEKKERNGLKLKTKIYADFITMIESFSKKETYDKFLFIVTPSSMSSEANEEELDHGFTKI